MTTERSYYISKFHMFIFMYFFKIGMNFPTAYRCGMMWGDHLSSATGVSDRSGGGGWKRGRNGSARAPRDSHEPAKSQRTGVQSRWANQKPNSQQSQVRGGV